MACAIPPQRRWSLRLHRLISAAIACLLVPRPAAATIPLITSDNARFTLGGYAKSLAGYQHIPYDTGGLVPDETGLGTQIVRLEWGLSVSDWFALEIHDRFFWQVTSGSGSLGAAVLGLGVSAPPGRSVDLESDILGSSSQQFFLRHDVDRLAARFFLEAFDVTVGRQAISWGNALIFPVADLWTQFSPFELDTSEKPGVDAVRVIASPTDRLQLDFIVADKGSLDDLSGGVRASLFLESTDVYVAAAKIWNELFLFAGAHADLSTVGLRIDAALPYHLDDQALKRPRVTAGLDYFATDLVLSVELHYNGAGADDASAYEAQLSSEAFGRGEIYFLGRYYAGLLVSYNLTTLLAANFSVLGNLADPSAVLVPSLVYQVSEGADLSLGAYIGVGDEPVLALPPNVRSEFGLYGQFYYAQMTAYF